jgi:hypothetical protein
LKYTIAIITSAAVFAILGLLAAWGTAAYYPSAEGGRAGRITDAFIMLPLGGAGVGLVIGCVGSMMGQRLRQE